MIRGMHGKSAYRPQRQNGREVGRAEGYQLGFRHGRRLGRCESIMRESTQKNDQIRDIRVVYVATGMIVPYTPLDEAIIKVLKRSVRELAVVYSTHDVAAFAKQYKPDLVFVLNGLNVPVEQIDAVRAQGAITAIWLTDDPYYTDMTMNMVSHYDYVFTLELSCVELYRNLGCKQVHYLPFAVDPDLFRPRHVDTSMRTDICFIGSAYWSRVSFFDQIAPYLKGKSTFICGWWWDRLQHYQMLQEKIQAGRWMSPKETSMRYNGAKIVINLHRAYDEDYNANSRKVPAYSVNPRMFEISGNGVFQLTDVRRDLENVYTPGYEVGVYTSPQELIEKIDYYLAHDDEREEIGLRALRRTMSQHTYSERLAAIFSVIFGDDSKAVNE